MVTKTSVKKTVRRSGKAKSMYKVTATFARVYKTAQEAKAAALNVRKVSKFAGVSPVKKTAKGYSLRVQFVMMTEDIKMRDNAAKSARASGARVTVSKV